MAKKPRRSPDFDNVLNAALEDFIEYGYDNAERLAYWQERLRRAAEASMTPLDEMQRQLQRALTDEYQREVDKGFAFKRHPGVSKFTIDKLRPELRGQLSKRIRASADLIVLNRKRTVEDTLQRFAGWATSVPEGGTRNTNKSQERAKVKAGMGNLSFRERRVLIDQSHKMTAAINDVIAVGGGAIAAHWKSPWRRSGYDYREDHKEREDESAKKPYLIRGSWADEQDLVKLGGSKWLDSMTQPGEEVFCSCTLKYVYNLGSLPREMLTRKGADRLDEARRRIAEMRAA